MTSFLAHQTIPFVDLSWQHGPLQADIVAAMAATLHQGDYVLGQAVTDFEVAFAKRVALPMASASAAGLMRSPSVCAPVASKPGRRNYPTGQYLYRHPNRGCANWCKTCLCRLRTRHGTDRSSPPPKGHHRKDQSHYCCPPLRSNGSPAQLQALAQRHRLIAFEDAAQAHLAEREGIRAGAIGLGAAFSFYPSKNLGALGDGGMVTTKAESVANRVRSLRNYGSTRKYFHTEAGGTNSRLDTLQASVLGLKLPHLEKWNCDRNQLAAYYDQALAPLAEQGILPIKNVSGSGHIYHLYVVRITAACRLDRAKLQIELSHRSIQTGIHYPTPCHLQPAYQTLGYSAGNFPNRRTPQPGNSVTPHVSRPHHHSDRSSSRRHPISRSPKNCPRLSSR